MLQDMDLIGKTVIADRGYDMNNILELIEKQQAVAVIPAENTAKFNERVIGGYTKNAIWSNAYSTNSNIIEGWLLAMISWPVPLRPFYRWPLFFYG